MDAPARTNSGIGFAALLLTACLPWVGAHVIERVPPQLWSFPPPLEIPRDYPRFSWIACALAISPLLAIAISWFFRRRPTHRHVNDEVASRPFPVWGRVAAVWTALVWVLAWTRFAWFAPLQHYTFFPLWLGFIITVNALTFRRGGTPIMLRRPQRWLLLFGASAIFWWLFEWLNRFARNWHYLGPAEVGAVEYALHASLCFSTVLPSVLAVREWLGTFGPLQTALEAGPRWSWATRRGFAIAAILLGALGLVLTGAYPLYTYPALWTAPLLLAGGALVLAKTENIWTGLASGDWREGGSWALAALICGFFWELWNVNSFAKWIYTVPFVDRWHIFEMPLLGYAGYLPFGLECALVCTFLLRPRNASSDRR